MDKKINWKLQGSGKALNLSVEGIKLPTLNDYEQYIKELLFKKDKNLIDEKSIEMSEGFLLYNEISSNKIITFFWRNKPVIVDSNNFKDVFAKLKEEEKDINKDRASISYKEILDESVEELRI